MYIFFKCQSEVYVCRREDITGDKNTGGFPPNLEYTHQLSQYRLVERGFKSV